MEERGERTSESPPRSDAVASVGAVGDRPSSGSGSFFRRGLEERGQDAKMPGRHPVQLRPGLEVGRYVLERFIDRGGMGEVWQALDTNLRRKVALKFVQSMRLEERVEKLFVREARAGARLLHQYIVTTFELGEASGLTWIAQELVPGSWTLADFLKEVRAKDALPPDYFANVAEFVARIADGLQAAHDAGVVHRDVKPRNVLIAPDDNPKITDFGLARVTGDSFVSHSGELVGTWSYMSPEQVTAKRMGLDHRTDVFSLGVVLYELLALQRPFNGTTTHQIAEQIVTLEPPDPRTVRADCPAWLAAVCSRAIEKAPGSRFQSMAAFARALRGGVADDASVAEDAPPENWASPFAEEAGAGLEPYPDPDAPELYGTTGVAPDSEFDASRVFDGEPYDVPARAFPAEASPGPGLRTWTEVLRTRGRARRRRRWWLAFLLLASAPFLLYAASSLVQLLLAELR